jgi:hypothetical protein
MKLVNKIDLETSKKTQESFLISHKPSLTDVCTWFSQTDIQSAAVEALHATSWQNFGLMSHTWQEKVVDKYTQGVTSDPNAAVRRGYALGLGALPADLLQRHADKVLQALMCAATTIQENPDERDAESRKNAVIGMIEVCETMRVEACYTQSAPGMTRKQVWERSAQSYTFTRIKKCEHIDTTIFSAMRTKIFLLKYFVSAPKNVRILGQSGLP